MENELSNNLINKQPIENEKVSFNIDKYEERGTELHQCTTNNDKLISQNILDQNANPRTFRNIEKFIKEKLNLNQDYDAQIANDGKDKNSTENTTNAYASNNVYTSDTKMTNIMNIIERKTGENTNEISRLTTTIYNLENPIKNLEETLINFL